jgi:chromosome segregation ATPase
VENGWIVAGSVLTGVLVALIGYLSTRRKTDVDREKEFRDDLLQRIDQQDRQLRQCEEGHRATRVELEGLRVEHHRVLDQVDEQAGNIRRLEEHVAQLQRDQDDRT